jgi:iron complex outermembrane receptor protein
VEHRQPHRRAGAGKPVTCAALFTLFASGAVGAQEAPLADQATVLELDTIRVEAGAFGLVATESAVGAKTDVPLLKTPRSISVVTQQDLVVRNVQADSQALTYTPGVLAQPFGGVQNQQNPFFTIRGFSSAFGGSFVDGVVSPVNYRYEPYGFEQYEVLRGPNSTLYGQSDPGGLVNRISKLPTATPFRELQLQGGDFDRLQGAFDIGGPVDGAGRLLYRLTGLARNADAPIDYDFGLTQPDERRFIAPALTARLSDATTVTILGAYLNDEVGQESVYRRPDNSLTRISLNPPDKGVWKQEQYAAGYLLSHAFSHSLGFEQTLRYSHMDSSILGTYQGELLPDGRTVTRYTDGNREWRDDFVVDSRLAYDFDTGPLRHDALLGFEYQRYTDWIAFVGGGAPDLDIRDPDYRARFPNDAAPYIQEKYSGDIYGLYFQDRVSLKDRWLVTFGVRQNWADSRTEDELYDAPAYDRSQNEATVSGGVTYLTDFGLAPYVSYAESFLPQAGATFSGDLFLPTTGEQWEVGVKYEPAGWDALLTAAVYEIRQRNVLTPDAANPYCAFCQVQTGEVRSRGVELQATASLAAVNLNASYAFNDTEITRASPDAAGASVEGNEMPLAPRHLASIWADYTLRSGFAQGLMLGAGVRYVGSTYADDANAIENAAYVVTDAALRYDLGSASPKLAGAVIALNVDNLFDEEYVTCFTPFYDCNHGASRTVMGTLTYQW